MKDESILISRVSSFILPPSSFDSAPRQLKHWVNNLTMLVNRFFVGVVLSTAFAAGAVSAHPAWGIVVDRNNQIYFSDIETIWKIDAQGKLSVFRAGVSGRHTHEIGFDENGDLYGADNSYESATQRSIAALWKMTPSGKFSYIVAPTYDPPKALTMWKDRAGNSYYVGQSENADHEMFVLRRTSDGQVLTLAGSRKAGADYRQVVLFSLGGMAFASDGALYFTDNSNIRKVTMDGQLTTLASNIAVEKSSESAMPENRLTRLFGIAVDAQANAFVADYGNRRVLEISPNGKLSTVTRSEPPWSPTGVALKDGNLYILEFGFTPPSTYSPRVRKLSSDGKITTLASIGNSPTLPNPETTAAKDPRLPATSKTLVRYGLIGLFATVFLGFVIWLMVRKKLNASST